MLPWHRRKPDIHAKDPALRRAAISADLAGQNALRRLLAADPDAGVREAAARRLSDLVLLRQALESDADERVREAARARYRQLLAGGDDLNLDYRLAALAACCNGQIIAHVARSAREPVLREAAIPRLTDRQLLGEVAAHDENASVRASAEQRLRALNRRGQADEGTSGVDSS
ncbi:MAG: hypothetical protein RI514_03700 [Spiribacter sp.]|jgi:hypothetical protein|nr:hypothetical protein [Spiribacter sp.]